MEGEGMKTFSVLALGIAIGFCAVPHGDAAVQNNRANERTRNDQICVYKDINYFGAEQCYRAGEEINNLGAQNDSISSIRVYGGATVTVYEKTAFAGRSAQFTSDVPDLGKRILTGNTGWSDRIESLKIAGSPVSNDRRNADDYRGNQPRQPRDGVCVYDRPNYGGRSECWNQGESISDLASQGGFRGQISSIRLFGGRTVAMVYREAGFRGESLTVDQDIPDLTAIRGRARGRGNGNGNANGRGNGNGRDLENWDRQISSLQVQSQRQSR
jgi:hypothetical protein